MIENSKTSIQFSDDLLIQENIIGITPFKTVTGPGGVVTLDMSVNNRTIYWSVKPATNWPWIFAGNLNLHYFSGFKRTVMISGSGAMGSRTSGYITLNAHNGGTVRMTGTATSLNGSNYQVMPNASMPFAPSR